MANHWKRRRKKKRVSGVDSVGGPDRNTGHWKRERVVAGADTIGGDIGMYGTRNIAVSDMLRKSTWPISTSSRKRKKLRI